MKISFLTETTVAKLLQLDVPSVAALRAVLKTTLEVKGANDSTDATIATTTMIERNPCIVTKYLNKQSGNACIGRVYSSKTQRERTERDSLSRRPFVLFLFFGHPFLDNSGNENISTVKMTESTCFS